MFSVTTLSPFLSLQHLKFHLVHIVMGVACFESNGKVWDWADLRRVALPVDDVVSLQQTDLPQVEESFHQLLVCLLLMSELVRPAYPRLPFL